MFIVVDGSQVNGERTGFASDGAVTRTCNLDTRPLTPDPERLCSEEPMMNGLQEVAHTKEILNRSGRLHAIEDSQASGLEVGGVDGAHMTSI